MQHALSSLLVSMIILGLPCSCAQADEHESSASWSVLIERFATADAAKRQQLESDLLKAQDERPRVIEALAAALDSSNPKISLASSQTLARACAETNGEFVLAQKSLKQIIAAAKAARQDSVRQNLATVLGRVGPLSDQVRDTLIQLLQKDSSVLVRVAAARALSQYCKLARPASARTAVAALVQSLKSDHSSTVRDTAATSLSMCSACPDIAIPGLEAGLEDNFLPVRISCVHACHSYGPAAKVVIPKLISMMKDESDTLMKETCMEAFSSIDPTDRTVVAALILMLDDPRYFQHAADALVGFREAGASAVPQLIAMLGSANPHVRGAAMRALSAIGPGARPALPALTKLLANDPAAKFFVQDTINKINASDSAPGARN